MNTIHLVLTKRKLFLHFYTLLYVDMQDDSRICYSYNRPATFSC